MNKKETRELASSYTAQFAKYLGGAMGLEIRHTLTDLFEAAIEKEREACAELASGVLATAYPINREVMHLPVLILERGAP